MSRDKLRITSVPAPDAAPSMASRVSFEVGDDSSIAGRVAGPLLAFLHAEPEIDEDSRKSLMELTKKIEAVLVKERPEQQTASSAPFSAGPPSRMATVTSLSPMEQMQSTSIKHQMSAPSLVPVKSHTRKNAVFDKEGFLSKTLPQKKLSLMAVQPYLDYSYDDSRMTVMEQLMGRKMYEWCALREEKILKMTWFLVIVSMSILVCSSLFSHEGTMAPYASALKLGMGCSCALVLILVTYYMNWKIFREIARTFDAIVLLIEITLFFIALFFVRCVSFEEIVFNVCGIGFFSQLFIFSDSFSLAARARLKYLRTILWICFLVFLLLYYNGVFELCYSYHFSLTKGAYENYKTTDHVDGTKALEWSISMFDFFVNRGMTVLVLMSKVILYSYKYPKDCTLIKSRMRRMEEAVVITSTGALSRRRAAHPK